MFSKGADFDTGANEYAWGAGTASGYTPELIEVDQVYSAI